MARLARVEVFAADEVAIVHCVARTTRRCFLLGDDPVSGRNFDHRKQWIEQRLKLHAGAFGIDLLGYAILSNHFHLVLRSRPDVVEHWSDEDVARRWLMLCPLRKNEPGQIAPTDLNTITNNKSRLQEIRARLSDVSWWMRLLNQTVAQQANREDGEVGKFWQARYRAVRILDETALLACAAYVDLNPIRAAMAETIETSDYTSAQQRVRRVQAEAGAAVDPESDERPAEFLSPVDLQEATGKPGPCVHDDERRCSDKGFLSMPEAAYLQLLDWTARQLRSDKRGATPKTARALFDRLGITRSQWLGLVESFGSLFAVMAGKPDRVDTYRSRDSNRRFRAPLAARELLSSA